MNAQDEKKSFHFGKYGCAAVLVCLIVWLAISCKEPAVPSGEFDTVLLGKQTVLVGGRLKPLDTVARTSLMIIRGRQSIRLEDGRKIEAMRWLSDLLFNAKVADQYPTFVIHNPEVLGLFGWQQAERKYFSYEELLPFVQSIDEHGQQASEVESARRTPYQTAILNLRNSMILYQRLKTSVFPMDVTDFQQELKSIASGKIDMLVGSNKYQFMADNGYLLCIPPELPHEDERGEWISIGTSLLRSLKNNQINPVVEFYAQIADAYRSKNIEAYSVSLKALDQWLREHEPKAVKKSNFECLFNHVEPFYKCMVLYVMAFLLVSLFWLLGQEHYRKTSFWILLIALGVHTFGLCARMYLQGRPPVTNLYSSAIFIGWGTVVIGLILERFYRDGIGAAAASVVGFITLIIAHHLAGGGDTLEMLQAVLDTNIWLATHVVTITIGYSAMFLAGILAILYVFRGVWTESLTKEAARSLTTMVYGVICFATLFSFVGTVLGGIWADQSWGRFWGWDPKENGALLIVLWCALMLHARWGGYIQQRGLMLMAIFGNVITSFSWFGVNMLGVGLHSYGFMEKGFPWLVGFCMSQMLIIWIGGYPIHRWKSAKHLLP